MGPDVEMISIAQLSSPSSAIETSKHRFSFPSPQNFEMKTTAYYSHP